MAEQNLLVKYWVNRIADDSVASKASVGAAGVGSRMRISHSREPLESLGLCCGWLAVGYAASLVPFAASTL